MVNLNTNHQQKRFWSSYLKLKLFLLLIGTSLHPTLAQDFPQSIVFQGIKVECNVQHLDENKKSGEYFEGDHVNVQFKITDTLTNEGIAGAYPAAWLGLNPPGKPIDCTKKIESFLTGSIFNRAELDMNVYYVVTMNDDASLTVVDPLFGYGGTKMLASVQLKSPAMDWDISNNQEYIFVSQPAAKEVAIIQTSNWKVIKNIPIPGVPVHTRLQPNENYLWITYVTEDQDNEDETGVAVLNTATQELERIIPTGAGWHEIIFNENNTYAYVSNGLSNNLSVIDISNLDKITDIPITEAPTTLAYSSLAKTVFVGHRGSGVIDMIDGEHFDLISTIDAEPGIEQIAIEPKGRFAFVVNPLEDVVHIIDNVNNTIVQTADVEDQPDQINFTDELAYIRHRGSEIVLMIPLSSIGVPGAQVQVIDFPGGQNPPAATALPSVASGIVQAPGESAVLVANALDKAVYFYMEGMAAPMGNFSNYGKAPRAVLVVDRSLQEMGNGLYQTTVELRDAGNYDIAFFMNAPRLTHCFKLDIQTSAAALLEKEIATFGNLRIEFLDQNEKIYLDEQKSLKFKIFNRRTKELLIGLMDVEVLQMANSGIWYQNMVAFPTEEPGVYEVDIQNLKEGYFSFFVGSLSQGFSLNQSIPQSYQIIQTRNPSKSGN